MFNYVQFVANFHLLIQKCLGAHFFSWTHGIYKIISGHSHLTHNSFDSYLTFPTWTLHKLTLFRPW